jgi:hypothetical protein
MENQQGESTVKQLGRNKRGLESDKILLETIKALPGLSQYELAQKLKWPSGRIDGSIRRLLKGKKIFIRIMERNGRHVNLVYPEDLKPADTIEVPAKLLHVGNPTWLNSAFVYGLDSSTIGISGRAVPEWAEISCFAGEVPITQDAEKVVVQIPEKIKRFYNFEQKHRVVSVNGNNLLITISGNIVEDKKCPA